MPVTSKYTYTPLNDKGFKELKQAIEETWNCCKDDKYTIMKISIELITEAVDKEDRIEKN